MPDVQKNTDLLREYVQRELDAPLFGIASTGQSWFHPEMEHLRKKLPYAVVIGYKIAYGITELLTDGPNQVYLAHYKQVNYLLDKGATQIAQWLEMQGSIAVPIPASQIVAWDNQYGHFSHRHAAVAAGLAFWGRNNLAITPQFGAHQRWVSILTDMPLIPGNKLEMDCGKCHACAKLCPASAIGESRDDWNYEKCFAKLKEFAKHGIGHYICGLCVKPCRGKAK